MAAKRPPGLDRIDIKILAALQRDGRTTMQHLARGRALAAGEPRAGAAAGKLRHHFRLSGRGRARRLSRPVTVFAEIILEKQANRARFEKRLAALEEVVECWEVSGNVDYMARFVCADLAAYEELTAP